MPAVARITLRDVERAVDQAVAEGWKIGYDRSRVIGVARVRELAGGGDHDRIRSMVILVLVNRGIRVPPGERQRASDILGRKVEGQAVKAAIPERSIRSAMRTFEQMLRSGRDPRSFLPAPMPGAGVPQMVGAVTDPCSKMIQKDDDQPRSPAGGVSREALGGAGQKPLSIQPGGVLDTMRQRREARALPDSLDFDPFDMNQVARRRAASDRVNGSKDDEPA